VLGPTITTTTIEEVFRSYRYQFTRTEDTFALDVPFWRADIVGAHDIAEEIGRYVGYDTIPPAPLPFEKSIEKNDTDEKITAVKWWCASQEFREVCTYTFRNSGEVSVVAGAKGKEKLRAHLSDGLKESFELNRLNAPLLGLTEVKLFEVGTVFFKDKESIHVAICDKGTIQELDLDEFIKEKHIDVSATPSFIPRLPSSPFVMWSLYPFITRDLAVWVSTPEKRSLLENMVREFSEKHCASPATLFDEFTKGDRTSVAYRFIFQASDRTLTDEEVTKTFQVLLDTVSAETAFEIR
jgi:phenylalanyl-tRNA synthetase beta subunit